jgi:hypothetical protein
LKKARYAEIWGDTVDLRQLPIAIIIGSVMSMVCFLLTSAGLTHWFPSLIKGLRDGYALLGGMLGALCAAVLCSRLFLPKRTFTEGEFSVDDQKALLEELKVDIREESENLKRTAPELIKEMKELQLYDLFHDGNVTEGVNK